METTNGLLKKSWCKDKTPELALFYNLACDRIAGFIGREEGIEAGEVINRIKSFGGNMPSGGDFSMATYVKLKNYLWKGYIYDRNSSGTPINDREIGFLKQILYKLDQIRNFQSHYYHSDEVLKFDKDLMHFVKRLYERAIYSLMEAYPAEVSEYWNRIQDRLKDNPGGSELFSKSKDEEDIFWLTREGKNFFLSLFLTRGEMKRFLKQRRGCKRDDTKDFRIKHEIYTYYCHRDGAARFHYNQDDDFLSQANETIVREILKKRQLYKINTYLNDVSTEITDPELFPLFLGQEKAVTAQDLITFCREKDLFKDLVLSIYEREDKVKKDKPKKNPPKKNPVVHIRHPDFDGICIEVGRKTFHRMVLDAIHSGEDFIIQKIASFSEERSDLINLVKTGPGLLSLPDDERQKMEALLNEYELFRIRTKRKALIRKFAQWHVALIHQLNTEKELRAKTLEKLKESPVTLRYLDLFYEEERKPRQKSRFMRFAVQYLIDFNVTPNLCWQWQAFEVRLNNEGQQVLTELTCLAPKNPGEGDWRLKFTHDDQILVSYNKGTKPQAEGEKKEPTQRMQTYLIGHRVMRNLLIAHLVGGKNIESLFETLEKELTGLRSGTDPTFELLEDIYIPPSLKKLAGYDLRSKTAKRIDTLAKRLEDIQKNKHNLRRAEKNRQIMRCYRFYEWQNRRSNGVEIFLRKHEYKLLSMYHYTMERGKLIKLLQAIGATNKIPKPVAQLLDKSEDLDSLFDNAINAARDWLAHQKHQLDIIPVKHVKKIARRLGVPVYENRKVDNSHVPFAIHPMLTIKAFYADELSRDKKFSLSAKIWKNKSIMSNLFDRNYNFDKYLDFFGGKELFAQTCKKEYRAMVGAVNQSLTHDGLLFWIAKKYDPLYRRVENMHDQEVEFFKFTIDKKPIKVIGKYRQFDDIIVAIRKKVVEKTVGQIFYQKKHAPEELTNIGITEEQGTYRVPFNVVKQEMDRIYHQSLAFIQAILSFEQDHIEGNAERADKEAQLSDGLPHLNFPAVLALSSLDESVKDELKEIRNTALHCNIPDGWSYEEKEKNSVLSPYLLPVLEKKKARKNLIKPGIN